MWIKFITNTQYNKVGDTVDVGEVEAKEKITKGEAVEAYISKPEVEEGVVLPKEEPPVVIQVRTRRRRKV